MNQLNISRLCKFAAIESAMLGHSLPYRIEVKNRNGMILGTCEVTADSIKTDFQTDAKYRAMIATTFDRSGKKWMCQLIHDDDGIQMRHSFSLCHHDTESDKEIMDRALFVAALFLPQPEAKTASAHQ